MRMGLCHLHTGARASSCLPPCSLGEAVKESPPLWASSQLPLLSAALALMSVERHFPISLGRLALLFAISLPLAQLSEEL